MSTTNAKLLPLLILLPLLLVLLLLLLPRSPCLQSHGLVYRHAMLMLPHDDQDSMSITVKSIWPKEALSHSVSSAVRYVPASMLAS